MKKLIFLLFVFTMFLSFFPGILSAIESEKKGYVSDKLWLTFREGPGESYRTIKSLISDTPVLVLDEMGDYFRVQLDSGEQGWVSKRFISFELPGTLIIEKLKQTNEKLENKIKELENKSVQVINEIKPDIEAVTITTKSTVKEAPKEVEKSASVGTAASIDQLIAEIENLLKTAMDSTSDAELVFSSNIEEYKVLIEQITEVRELARENKALNEKTNSLSDQLTFLQETQNSLTPLFFKSDMIKWALFGVGVLILGWIFGHSISIHRRRRNSYLLD